MSYRIRFTLTHGSTGHWAREYATREEAQQAIDDRQKETGLAYVVEEVVAHEATPEARIRELEAELTQLRDAYDAARQDLDVAKRNVARLESTLGMVQASWAASVASSDADRAITRQHRMEVEALCLCLDRAIDLGNSMHAAHQSEEWAAFRDALAASPQGPAKASGGAGGTAHTGPAHQPGAGQGVASRLIVDLGAIERDGPAKASEAPGEGGDSGSSSSDALEAFLRADTCRSIKAIKDGRFIVTVPGLLGSPASGTLRGISVCVEKMVKSNASWLLPIDRPEDKFGEGTNRWRLYAFEHFLDGNDDASITWHEGQFHAVAGDVRIQATTICGLADKLAENKEDKP